MKLLRVALALASLYRCHAYLKDANGDTLDIYRNCKGVNDTAACRLDARIAWCPNNPRMPGFSTPFPDDKDIGGPGLPCNADLKKFRKFEGGDWFLFLAYAGGLVYIFTGYRIAQNYFWKPSWNALLSFVGMGASTQELNSDHFATFANCIGHFYIAVIATGMTRSTIGLSILVGCCAIEIWVIGGLAVLFNPGGANLHIVGFDLLKDIVFHGASIAGFFFFTGFMDPPEAVIKAAKNKQTNLAAAASGTGDANASAAGDVLGSINVADWFLVLGLFGLWVGYTLLVFLENCCCKSCLGSGEQEDDQSKQARIEKKAGESVRGGDVENAEYPNVPNFDDPDAQAKADGGGDVVDGLQAELKRAQSTSLWVPPESYLGKLKWFLTWPFWITFTFTIPTFRDDEDPGHYRDIGWSDIFRVIVSNFMVNIWMIFFAFLIVHFGCIIGAVLDFEYSVVGLVIFAVGLSFENLLDAMYCGWTDSDTAYQLSEGFAAQVNNFTFTLGCIFTVYMFQEKEQMQVYDGMRLAMALCACAAVALYLFLWIRDMEATPVLGCLMVEFGIVLCGAILYLTYEKPNLRLTWSASAGN